MDESVGVGLIVGLAIGVTTYLWNSVYFSKAQKYVLLAFIAFPPLQWATAIILFIYNYQKFKSSKEHKVETAKNTAVSSLKELREKGILTEVEYQEKISKVESQKLENTREYKQLKNLFDSGILTKEEFENKVKLLNKTSKLPPTKSYRIIDGYSEGLALAIDENLEYGFVDEKGETVINFIFEQDPPYN